MAYLRLSDPTTDSCEFKVKLSNSFNTKYYRSLRITGSNYGSSTSNVRRYVEERRARSSTSSRYVRGTVNDGMSAGRTYTLYAYAQAQNGTWYKAGSDTITMKSNSGSHSNHSGSKEFDLGIKEIEHLSAEPFAVGQDLKFRVQIKNYERQDSPRYRVVLKDIQGNTLDTENCTSLNGKSYDNEYLRTTLRDSHIVNGEARYTFSIECGEDGYRDSSSNDNTKIKSYKVKNNNATKPNVDKLGVPKVIGTEIDGNNVKIRFEKASGSEFTILADRNKKQLNYSYEDYINVTLPEYTTQYKLFLRGGASRGVRGEWTQLYLTTGPRVYSPTNVSYEVQPDGLNVTLKFTKGRNTSKTIIRNAETGMIIDSVENETSHLKFKIYNRTYTIELHGVDGNVEGTTYTRIKIKTGNKPVVKPKPPVVKPKPPVVKPKPPVGEGIKVAAIQHMLWYLGYLGERSDIDGNFGQKTEKAVKSYQKSNGLPVTGVVDETTRRRMLESSCKLKKAIESDVTQGGIFKEWKIAPYMIEDREYVLTDTPLLTVKAKFSMFPTKGTSEMSGDLVSKTAANGTIYSGPASADASFKFDGGKVKSAIDAIGVKIGSAHGADLRFKLVNNPDPNEVTVLLEYCKTIGGHNVYQIIEVTIRKMQRINFKGVTIDYYGELDRTLEKALVGVTSIVVGVLCVFAVMSLQGIAASAAAALAMRLKDIAIKIMDICEQFNMAVPVPAK